MGCGLARNIGELVAARAFAGVGGGGMSVCTSILLSDIVSLRERGQWQGYVNLVYAFGASAGAPLGGLWGERQPLGVPGPGPNVCHGLHCCGARA